MIDFSKPVRTISTHSKVTILTTQGLGSHPVIGIVPSRDSESYIETRWDFEI
jgi:hypothetical protein